MLSSSQASAVTAPMCHQHNLPYFSLLFIIYDLIVPLYSDSFSLLYLIRSTFLTPLCSYILISLRSSLLSPLFSLHSSPLWYFFSLRSTSFFSTCLHSAALIYYIIVSLGSIFSVLCALLALYLLCSTLIAHIVIISASSAFSDLH